MATLTKGKTFTSGETVTPTKLHELVDLGTVTNIVDADISATAAIALSKLATGALPAAITVAQSNVASNVTTTGPAFRAYATAATTGLNNGVPKKVELAGETFDTANCFASSRFTPNVAGYYFISAGVRFEALVNASAFIVKNGAIYAVGSTPNAGSYHSVVTDLVYLNGTTDYVELHAAQYTGNNQSTGTPTSDSTWMSGFLARAA